MWKSACLWIAIGVASPLWAGRPLVKVTLLGDAGSGKTCLLWRMIGKGDCRNIPTIGIDMHRMSMNVDDNEYEFEFRDTAGAERFSAIALSFLRNVNGAFLVFDLTRHQSFENLKSLWFPQAKHSGLPIILIGNKSDLSHAEVSDAEIREFARQHGLQYFRTSAVTQSFEALQPVLSAMLKIAMPPAAPETVRLPPLLDEQRDRAERQRSRRCCS